MEISEQQLKELKSFFDYFDKDGSGSLDKQELNELIRMMMDYNTNQMPTQQEKLDLLAEVDQDGNGNIQYEEFQSLFKRKLMKASVDKQMKMAFELIDIGKNQYITYKQLLRICNQLNMGFTDQEVKKMIDKGSKGTGMVDFQSFKQMMKNQNI